MSLVSASTFTLPAYPSLHPKPHLDRFYCAYIKGDPGETTNHNRRIDPALVAKANEKTGRSRGDFEVEEISRERHEKLRQFLE
jgi:hypothetical protein